MAKSGSTKGALGFIGGILIIIAMFISWLVITAKFLIWSTTMTVNGFGVWSNADINVSSVLMPLMNAGILIFAGGIVAAIVGILMLAKVIDTINYRVGYILLLVAGALALIGFIMWVAGASNVDLGILNHNANLFQNASIGNGLWFALVGSILAILDGALYLVTSRKSASRSSSRSSRSKNSRSKK